jgi:hypothetical protein
MVAPASLSFCPIQARAANALAISRRLALFAFQPSLSAMFAAGAMSSPIDPPPIAREHCRHYSYDRGSNFLDGGPRCALGLDISAPGASRCCWPDPAIPCDSRENWSDQEKATWEAWRADRSRRMIAAIAAVPALDGCATEKVKCPSCTGTITYIRIPTRAYVECSTPHCVQFEANVRGSWPEKSA